MERIVIPATGRTFTVMSHKKTLGGKPVANKDDDLPLVEFRVKGTMQYQLRLAEPVEERPEFHIFGSHGMTDTHIVRVVGGGRQTMAKVAIDMLFRHKGPLPADAALHFRLFVYKRNHDESEAAGHTVWVKQRVGAGYMFLTTIYPPPASPRPIGLYMEQTTAREAKKGTIVFSYDPSNPEAAGVVVASDVLARMREYWTKHGGDKRLANGTVPIHAEPTPFDYTDDNAGRLVGMVQDYINKNELELYIDEIAPGGRAPLGHTVNKSSRVHMVQWTTPVAVVPAALYTLPPASFRTRTRDEWREQEPFYLNLMKIALRRCDCSPSEFVSLAKAQLASEKTTVEPGTRLVELVLQEYVSAVATAVPYTEDSIYLKTGDVTAAPYVRKNNEDFGDGYLRGTEDCEGLTRMMALTFFATKAPYDSEILTIAGKFLDLYVPEYSLTMVDAMSLGRATKSQIAGRLGTGKPLLELDPRAESARADSAAAHMCLTLTPVTVHAERISRCNGTPLQVMVPDPEAFVARHVRPFSDDLRVIQCEGTGHLHEILPATLFATSEQERAAERKRLDKRAEIHSAVERHCPVLLTVGKPTYVQNNHGAIKSLTDKKYTPFSVFYGWYQTVMTPFWLEYGIPIMKFGVVALDGGPYRDGRPRLTVPAERIYLKDPAVGYYTYEPIHEALMAGCLSMLSHEQPTPVASVVNGMIGKYGGEAKLVHHKYSEEDMPKGAAVPPQDVVIGRHGRNVRDSKVFDTKLLPRFDDEREETVEERKARAARAARGVHADKLNIAEGRAVRSIDLDNNLRVTVEKVARGIKNEADTTAISPEIAALINAGKILFDSSVILSSDSPLAATSAGNVAKAYRNLSDKQRRARARMDYYFREDVFDGVIAALAQLVAVSDVIEGIEITPEILHVDKKGDPLNPVIRVSLFAYI